MRATPLLLLYLQAPGIRVHPYPPLRFGHEGIDLELIEVRFGKVGHLLSQISKFSIGVHEFLTVERTGEEFLVLGMHGTRAAQQEINLTRCRFRSSRLEGFNPAGEDVYGSDPLFLFFGNGSGLGRG